MDRNAVDRWNRQRGAALGFAIGCVLMLLYLFIDGLLRK